MIPLFKLPVDPFVAKNKLKWVKITDNLYLFNFRLNICKYVSVYYVAVRTIVLSRHGSNLARPVIIHDIIHGLIYVPSTPCCGFFGVSLDGNCAYVHWGSFTSSSRSVRRVIWFTWFSEPHECIQHLAVPGGHPSNYEPGAALLNFNKPLSERRIP